MAGSPFSTSWYRIAPLRMRLRGHVEIHDHLYRGITWRIVEDRQTGRFHRLTPAAYFFVCKMDGVRTVDEIWSLTERRYGGDCPTQDEAIRLLSQLHNSDLLMGDDLPDLGEIDRRSVEMDRRTMMSRIKNPMALRIPLIDPDGFIKATMPLVGWMFTTFGMVLWLLLVAAGAIQAALLWPELTTNVSDRVLSGQNLLLLALVYPVIKTIHEFAHAYAVRRWGGEVHEMGVMFLVLLPVPYVDASASIAFRQWSRRAVVAGAGIFAELALAAIAILLWAHTEPGVVRAALFNVALIGGVSTLLFNGNPLLRFDGYYMLTDAIGIPNLATRANRYLSYLVQRYAFGREDIESPVVSRGERPWFVFYAVAAFLYRLTVMMAISLFVASRFFFVGVLLAALVVANMLVFPVLKGAWFVIAGSALQAQRRRAVMVTSAIAAALVGVLWMVPLPHATLAEGVIQPPEGNIVRAGTAGIVTEVLVENGANVTKGAAILRLADPRLDAQMEIRQAQLRGLSARRTAALALDPGQVRFVEAEIASALDELERLKERQNLLDVRSPRDGQWALTVTPDVEGLFVGRGDVLGEILQDSTPPILAVVTQAEVDQVRQRTDDVDIRLVHNPKATWPARIKREIPAAGRRLPSHALTTEGGGAFAVDPQTPDGLSALETVFRFELELVPSESGDVPKTYSGERVYVRFDHGREPLYRRIYGAGRRLFLSALNV